MNERVMQFRIGMFVIVAGLVLTMLIVWFGESPALFRDHVFVTARYDEAPGVNIGVPVRKSGIRIGEVVRIDFDERPGQPDGVLITLSIEQKYRIKEGSVPRISRALIGDVSIDMLPGSGPGLLTQATSPEDAPIINGEVAPDPARALAAATEAFQKAGQTLASIEEAASGIAGVTKDAKGVGEFLATWKQTGTRVAAAADGIDRVIRENEAGLKPAIVNLRDVTAKVNGVLDEQTQSDIKTTAERLAKASAQLDAGLADIRPLLRDLGAAVTSNPTTNFGQTVYRINRIAYDVGLLTQQMGDANGKLNTNGSLQKLVTSSELYDNLNRMTSLASEVLAGARPVVTAFRSFAEKIARDPSILSRGALQR